MRKTFRSWPSLSLYFLVQSVFIVLADFHNNFFLLWIDWTSRPSLPSVRFAIIRVNASRLVADSQIKYDLIITIRSIDTSRLTDYQHVNHKWVPNSTNKELLIDKLLADTPIEPLKFNWTDFTMYWAHVSTYLRGHSNSTVVSTALLTDLLYLKLWYLV